MNRGFAERQPRASGMMDFDERDLFALAERAGFADLHFELLREATTREAPIAWSSFASSSPNPLAPTVSEAVTRALTPEEATRFVAHLRPRVEKDRRMHRLAVAHLWAERPGR